MKIHSPSQVGMAILFMIALGIGYDVYINEDQGNVNWILLLIVLFIALYVLKAQIDYWWHEKHPLPIEPEIKKWLVHNFPFYNTLEGDLKQKFEDRIGLYCEARIFTSLGSKERAVPDDLKAMIAAHAIRVTLKHEDFLIGDFDRIMMYKHPFPTPRHKFLHIVETEVEDGVIIFTLDYLMNGVLEPAQYYNIAYHAYIEAFCKQNPTIDFSFLESVTTDHMELISGFKVEDLLTTLGYKSLDPVPVVATYYFTFNDKFTELLPDVVKQLDDIFKC